MIIARAIALAALLACILSFSPGCKKADSAAASTGATVNRDTPKAAAKSLFQAMYDNDRASAVQCLTPGQVQEQSLDAMMPVVVGMRKATDAMAKRFGKDIDKLAGGPVDATRIDPKMIDQGKETVTGDTATIVTPKQTIQLVRGADGWRVDLAKSINLNDPKLLAVTKPMFAAMGRAGEEVAREVEAGKYQDVVAGVNALKARIQQAIEAEKQRMIAELKKGR